MTGQYKVSIGSERHAPSAASAMATAATGRRLISPVTVTCLPSRLTGCLNLKLSKLARAEVEPIADGLLQSSEINPTQPLADHQSPYVSRDSVDRKKPTTGLPRGSALLNVTSNL
jgi:hypothetical protein